jgi:protein phosphatase
MWFFIVQPGDLMPFQLSVASATDIGLVREDNQDSAYAWAKNPLQGIPAALLVVADGIGGFQAGDIASKLATDTMVEIVVPFLEESNAGDDAPQSLLEKMLREAMLKANLAVWRYAKYHLDGRAMGCTLTCLLVEGRNVLVSHVGDSRAYQLEGGILRQLTIDHTPAGELYELGQIDYREMLYHPQRHVLTRAIGLSPMLDVELRATVLKVESRLFVCTDGLWGFIPEIQLERLVSRPGPPRTIARELISAANAYGGSDNIGVAICDVRDPLLHRY